MYQEKPRTDRLSLEDVENRKKQKQRDSYTQRGSAAGRVMLEYTVNIWLYMQVKNVWMDEQNTQIC